jgi:hypothetical protein
MAFDDALRAGGFRRWYERQLIESHAWLVTGFLALIMMAIALEVVEFRETRGGFLLLVVIALSGAALCAVAWKRFTRQLFCAEAMAEQAVCARCETYGRFAVIDAHADPAKISGRAVHVRCRHCGHDWTMG